MKFNFPAIVPSLSVLALLAAAPTAALAQDANDEGSAEEEIVVIGSQIRGVAATGSQTISVDSEAIADRAAGTTNELLSLIPQITNTFNGRFEGDPRGVSAGISITKPNLRNLPGANSTSGGTSLVLMDGFRFTPVGVNQSAVDVDIIPSAVLAGIDTVTDGGSSLYGADAVAGVINFRTLREFEGLKVDGNYAAGDTISGFNQWDGQITAGTSWSTGNAYISGGYSHRDLILNNETTWATGEVYSTAGVPRFTGTQCNIPLGQETRWKRFGPGATQFTSNPLASGAGVFAVGGANCDVVGLATYLPENTRSNVFARLTNDFGDTISLDVTAYWTQRDQELLNFPRGFSSAGSGITTAAQLLAAFPAASATPVNGFFNVTEGVGFSFAPNAAYVNTPTTLGFETWGVTPGLTFELGGDWQLRTTLHYGQSTNYQAFPGVDAVRAQCYISGRISGNTAPCAGISTGGQLNPLNVAAASAAVITDIIDFESAQETEQQLVVFRAVGDGPLFQLPGGAARLAVGAEYQDNQADSRLNAGRVGSLSALPFMSYSRDSYSAFGELALPVTDFLDLSASIRYDEYSDFGDTTNPSLGFNLHPVDGLSIYGHWGTSFNAPTAVDGLGIATGRFACGIYTANGSPRPNDPFGEDNGQGTCAMISEGVKAGIQPQTAESWAFGFDAEPMDGLRIGGQFYSIAFDDVLGAVNPQNLNTYVTNPELYFYAITPAQYAAFLSEFTNGAQLATQRSNTDIGLYIDRRTSNIGTAQLEGVDFHAYYDRPIGDAELSLGVSGTYVTKSISNFGTEVDQRQQGGPALTFTAFAGVDFGAFSSRVTANYSGEFNSTSFNINNQTGDEVSPFTTVNLNFGYQFDESDGLLAGTSLRLAINNVFEETPETFRRGTSAAASLVTYENWSLGRDIRVGFSKTF